MGNEHSSRAERDDLPVGRHASVVRKNESESMDLRRIFVRRWSVRNDSGFHVVPVRWVIEARRTIDVPKEVLVRPLVIFVECVRFAKMRGQTIDECSAPAQTIPVQPRSAHAAKFVVRVSESVHGPPLNVAGFFLCANPGIYEPVFAVLDTLLHFTPFPGGREQFEYRGFNIKCSATIGAAGFFASVTVSRTTTGGARAKRSVLAS